MAPRTPEQNEEIREQTRQQIKEAAFRLFAREGFSQASVSGIAKGAGISKGLIYHYFSSKEEILVSIFEDLQHLGEQLLEFPEDLPGEQRLEMVLERMFRYLEESGEVIRLMISLALQPDAVEALQPHIRRENERQVMIMTDILATMGIPDPRNEAYYLASKLDGIALGYISMGEDYPIETIKKKILEEYVTGK